MAPRLDFIGFQNLHQGSGPLCAFVSTFIEQKGILKGVFTSFAEGRPSERRSAGGFSACFSQTSFRRDPRGEWDGWWALIGDRGYSCLILLSTKVEEKHRHPAATGEQAGGKERKQEEGRNSK